MRLRRIFRPSPLARLRTPLAVLGGVGLLALVGTRAVPHGLFRASGEPPPVVAAAAGEVRVLDGTTLRLGRQVLRLAALQAPERGQATCRAAGQAQDCGAAATDALAALVAGRGVACRIDGADRRGRALGTCEADGVEVNAFLVASGWALAEPPASPALAAAEAAARQGGRGLWGSARPAPESWR